MSDIRKSQAFHSKRPARRFVEGGSVVIQRDGNMFIVKKAQDLHSVKRYRIAGYQHVLVASQFLRKGHATSNGDFDALERDVLNAMRRFVVRTSNPAL